MSTIILSETSTASQQVDSRTTELRRTLLHVLHEWDRTESAVAPVRVSCPCAGHTHNDANPSLDVSVQEHTDKRGRKSYVLSFNCWTRKHTPADMLKALGVEFWLELFAQWKGLPPDILKRAGVTVEADEKGRLHYTFPYHDLNLQEVIGTRYRWLPKRFWFQTGVRSSKALFLPLPVNSDYICLVEGETDALALASAGFPVAGVAGKGILFSEKVAGRRLYEALSRRFKRLYISVEPDADDQTAALSRQIDGLDVEVYLIRMKETGYKDPCEMLKALGVERFHDEWQKLMDSAERVEPAQEDEAVARQTVMPVESAQEVLQFIQSLIQTGQADVIVKGLDVAKEALKAAKRERKGPNHVDIAHGLMEKFRFERYKDGMWWYDEQEGIWKGNAAELIESLVHRHVDIPDEQKRRSFAAEVVAHIEALSWSPDRELLPDPPLTLIPFRNGVYDIQTDQLRPYQPGDYFTSKLPWGYNPHAQSHILRERLAAHEPLIQRHFMEFLAYCLWRSYPRHRFFIWTGGGRNGKGYLVRVLQLALGAENIAHETMESLSSDKWAAANLYRKLANIAGEVGDKELLRTDVLKAATGGDTLKGERKFQDAFNFKNHAKMLFLPNSVPPTTDKTIAFYSRAVIIEFSRQFNENPTIENELEMMDYETCEQEFGWLLTQAVTVLRELLQNGFQFTGDKSVDEKREHYERLSKPLHRFLDEHTERTYDLNDYIPKYDMLLRVNDWLKDRRLSQLTDRKLNEQMRELGFQEMKKEVQPGKKWWCFVGLKWKETAGVEQCSSQSGGVSSVGGVSGSNNSRNSNTLQPFACEEEKIKNEKRFEDIGVSGVSGTANATQDTNATQTPPTLEDLDPFASADPSLFIQECCVVEPEAEVVAGELYAAYTRWADGRAETPLTDRAFGKWLSAAGYPADKGTKGIRIRHGLRLRDDLNLFDDEETDKIRRLRDALQSIPGEQLLSLIKHIQTMLDERPHVKLLVDRVTGWERERVDYGQGYQELLSRFIDDLLGFTGWTVMKAEHLAGLVVALLLGRGVELVGQNGDTLAVGARLKPDEPALPPQDLSGKQQKLLEKYEQQLETLDYKLQEQEKGEPIMEKQESSFMVKDRHVDDVPEPAYADIPEVDIPEPAPWEGVRRVVIDIETTTLDPHAPDARVLAVGWKDWTGREHIWMGDERDILRKFLLALEQERPEVLAGHNIYSFDLPYIVARCEAHGLTTPFSVGTFTMRVPNTMGTLFSDREIEFTPVWLDGCAVIDTLHLACRYDYSARTLSAYDLKSVARELCVREREVTLDKDNILRAYEQDPLDFRQYLLDDLRDTWAIMETLAPAYHYVAGVLNYPYWKVFTAGNASLWEHLLEQHYGLSRDEAREMADEKRDYDGGLVVARTGIYHDCCKVDVSSLYPSIMLHYGIHSRKDTDSISLAYLKRMTEQRLELKRRAKAGDREADRLQSAFKILINSLYGFLGTAGIGFNDMDAAEAVTRTGRALLTRMLYALEQAGYTIVEADTDGIIVQGDGETALQVAQSVLPQGFSLELDWTGKNVYCHARKNYVIFNPDGTIYERRGGAYRSRDRNRLSKECLLEFIRKLSFDGPGSAKQYARAVYRHIVSGQAWEMVAERKRVSEKDNSRFSRMAIERGYRYGDKPSAARAVDGYSFSPDEGYDIKFYAKKWVDTVKDILARIREQSVYVSSDKKESDQHGNND